jgi:muconolactone delta-isomerase
MLPELGKAMAGMEARAQELNVKTLFVVNAAPEHVAYGLFEADDAYSLAQLLTDVPLRQDFKVSAVEYQKDIMKRAMEAAAARG